MPVTKQIQSLKNLIHPYFDDGLIECGIDEAGRGCGAGPVVAAAVILSSDFHHPLLNDSKKMNASQRLIMEDIIKEHAISYGIGVAEVSEIDAINILQATFLAMHRAIDELNLPVQRFLIDGNRFRTERHINYHTIIGGDGKIASIAAASVLAKTYRDRLMISLHEDYPVYGWGDNKGYLTRKHREACAKHGLTPHHRTSFTILK